MTTGYTPRPDAPPERLVLVDDGTGERLYAGPAETAAWTDGAGDERVVEVAGARYRVAPGPGAVSREIHQGVGLVRVVTHRAWPAGTNGAAPPR